MPFTKAPRSAAYSSFCRSRGSFGRSFSVTCDGCRAFRFSRGRCETPAATPFFGFGPEPSRAPPQLLNGSTACFGFRAVPGQIDSKIVERVEVLQGLLQEGFVGHRTRIPETA